MCALNGQYGDPDAVRKAPEKRTTPKKNHTAGSFRRFFYSVLFSGSFFQFLALGDILPQLVPSELSGGGLSVGQQASAASRQLVSLVSK